MLDIVGKTISGVIENAPSEWDGKPSDEMLLIHFTDGLSLKVVGGGDDMDNWLSAEPIDPVAVLALEDKASEYERKQQDQACEREEWLALSCDERAAQRKPDDGFIPAAYVEDIARSLGMTSLVTPCPKCGDAECPNAPVRDIRSGWSVA